MQAMQKIVSQVFLLSSYFLAILVLFMLVVPPQIFAGGGPLRLEADAVKGTLGKPLTIRAYLKENEVFSSPQNVHIKVRNQRPSDNCTMSTTLINDRNQVTAQCSSTEEGSLEIYAEWVEGGSQSTPFFLTYERADSSVQVVQPLQASPASSPTSKKSPDTEAPPSSPLVVMKNPEASSSSILSAGGASQNNFEINNLAAVPMIATFLVGMSSTTLGLFGREPNRLRNIYLVIGVLAITLSVILCMSWYRKSLILEKPANDTMPSPTSTLLVDTIAPFLGSGIQGVSDGSTITSDNFCMTTSYQDDSENVVVRTQLSGEEWSDWQNDQTFCYEDLQNGPSTLQIEAKDQQDNLATTQLNFTVNFIYDVPIKLVGEVIDDKNCNYIRDPGEPGLADIPVPIYASDSNGRKLVKELKTDGQGFFTYTSSIKSDQKSTIQAEVYVANYGINNFPEMPGSVIFSAKNPSVKQLFPLFKVEGGSCSQIAI